MLTIQQAGIEILGNHPQPLYLFCGMEYGIKNKYLNSLAQLYNKVVEFDCFSDLFKTFERKSIVSSSPALYVVRYDLDFVKSIDKVKAAKMISKFPNIRGCAVGIYEDEKQFKKLDKLFPENVVRFDAISSQYIEKYIREDYPELDSRYIHLISDKCPGGYGQAKIVAGQLDSIRNHLHSLEDEDILNLFGLGTSRTEQAMMLATAARSFEDVMSVVDSFEDDLNFLINGMCHVAINLDKCMDKRNTDLPESKYVKYWTREDVYNFYEQAYNQTLKLRSTVGGNAYDSLVYLASLLRYRNIPSISEVS